MTLFTENGHDLNGYDLANGPKQLGVRLALFEKWLLPRAWPTKITNSQ